MIKLKQFFWGDVELEIKESNRTHTPVRFVYGYVFKDIDEQWNRATELRKNNYHDLAESPVVYIHESDIQEIEPFDIDKEPLIIQPYGQANTDKESS